MEEITLKSLITKFLGEYRNNEAFCICEGDNFRSISYGEFATDILRGVAYFKKNKLHDIHIAFMAKNSYEWITLYFSVLLTGNVAVLINQNLPEEERIWQCEFADVTHVFSDCDLSHFLLSDATPAELTWSEISASEPITLDEIDDGSQDTLCTILFTSGTLGTSKGVMLSKRNIITRILQTVRNLPTDRTLQVLPFYHSGGFGGAFKVLFVGSTICFGRGLKYIFQDIPRLKISSLIMVPSIVETFEKLLRRFPDHDAYRAQFGDTLKTIFLVGALPKKETILLLMEYNFQLCTVYGLTETAGCGTAGIFSKNVLSGIGSAKAGAEIRLQKGEIQISGPCLMLGYYKDPEATNQAIENGWLHTGDMGRVDENGWYYLTGRKKNVIILSNGENVSPEEIEATLYRNADILECMVYSIPKGICADIYTTNPEVAADYVKEYNQENPTYRRIFKVNYFDQPLPKTGSGKIKRKENRYE